MRAAAVFNRLLGFKGTVIEKVSFDNDAAVVVVQVRPSARTLRCPCGRRSRARYDTSRRRWRHLDLGRHEVIIEADIRRIDCRFCRRVRTEAVPWARPGARHTHDFENTAGWLVKRMSKAGAASFLRTTWETIDALVRRLVAAHLADNRLAGPCRIGVDEISYRRGRKFLTVVADHDTSRIIFIGEGRSQHVLNTFFDSLDPTTLAGIEAVSMDMTPIYRKSTDARIPHAAICLDPFHVIAWAGEALEATYKTTQHHLAPIRIDGHSPAQTWRKVRAALRTPAEKHTPIHTAIINQLRRHHPDLHHAWRLKEQLRRLYTTNPRNAARHLTGWTNRAHQHPGNAFPTLARRLQHHRTGILNAIHHQLSNSLLEATNAGIRLIQRRAHGYANLDNLIEMIHLCHGGITTQLPTPTR